jgi:phosphoribosylaminoimidazolecarboxamide formyltransferase/IMP cyclohydrolase
VLQNHKDVMVVVDPDDYSEVLAKLQGGDDGDNSFRRRLAWKAFQHASSYDSAVAEWLWKHQRDGGMLSGLQNC